MVKAADTPALARSLFVWLPAVWCPRILGFYVNGRKGERAKGKENWERRKTNNHPAIRYFTVFGVHPLSARFEREIHIYVNEKEAGRMREGGREGGKVVMRHRRPFTHSVTFKYAHSASPVVIGRYGYDYYGRPFSRGRFS